MKKIRVGGVLEDLVVLNKHYKSKNVTVSNKPSLRKAAQAGRLITSFADIKAGATVYGFVRGLLPDKIFLELGNNISGAVFKSQLTDEMLRSPNFGLRKDQSVTAKVTHVDEAKELFWLSMKTDADLDMDSASKGTEPVGEPLVDPVDPNITSTADIEFGVAASVRVRSIKNTQLNVSLGENVQGRISVAEIFESWDDIKDKKNPLAQFKMNDTIKAKILGRHDARNHRFLPITHRSSNKTPTYELTAKKDKLTTEADVLSLDKITPDATLVAFVNNIADRFVWVNISANVRGRIDFLDLTDDLEKLSAIESNFPVGSALKVRVKSVDVAAGRLDLTAASSVAGNKLTLKDLKVGYVLPARVTKTHDTSIVVQINESIAAPIYLEQLADDYDKAKPSEFKTGDVLRVCVVDVDVPNKKLGLSARPSKVLSASLPVKDPEIKDRSDLKINQVVRGFIKQVTDNGIYVRLGPKVEAYVRITRYRKGHLQQRQHAQPSDELEDLGHPGRVH
ncbi:RNA binding [Ascochyta rabiei]|uniref:RNA binding n=1 Tax=Didymella rabiei TaxID=5454 RepID=A0A163L4H2_DIDRA|nr:RNA binding [Ascochyta rabiei]